MHEYGGPKLIHSILKAFNVLHIETVFIAFMNAERYIDNILISALSLYQTCTCTSY